MAKINKQESATDEKDLNCTNDEQNSEFMAQNEAFDSTNPDTTKGKISKSKKSKSGKSSNYDSPRVCTQSTVEELSFDNDYSENSHDKQAGLQDEESSTDFSGEFDSSCDIVENEKNPESNDIDCDLAAEKEKYLRLLAEYDNFRKRSAKEKSAAFAEARVTAITAMLPVYDNLERALKMPCVDDAFYKGVEMTMAGFTEIFEGLGVEVIDSVGKPFDPNLHNAVMTIEDPGLGEKIVAEEFQKGFKLGDRVIRFSTVVVAN